MPTWVRDRVLPVAAALVLGTGAGLSLDHGDGSLVASQPGTVPVEISELRTSVAVLTEQVHQLRGEIQALRDELQSWRRDQR